MRMPSHFLRIKVNLFCIQEEPAVNPEELEKKIERLNKVDIIKYIKVVFVFCINFQYDFC